MTEAERWLAWLDGDRRDDGTRRMVGTPYQAAQRIAARLHELERLERGRCYYLALQRPDGWPNEIVDGPHSTPEGVVKAHAIYERIMGRDESVSYVMVSAEPLPEMTVEINGEAADECARLLGRTDSDGMGCG